MKLTERQQRILRLAGETSGVSTNRRTAEALSRRGLVTARPAAFGGATSITLTELGREIAAELTATRNAARKH